MDIEKLTEDIFKYTLIKDLKTEIVNDEEPNSTIVRAWFFIKKSKYGAECVIPSDWVEYAIQRSIANLRFQLEKTDEEVKRVAVEYGLL